MSAIVEPHRPYGDRDGYAGTTRDTLTPGASRSAVSWGAVFAGAAAAAALSLILLLLGTGLGSILFIYAVEHTGAARTAFLTTSAPVFALPMGVMFLSEKLTPRVLLGTAVTILGIWLVLI